MALNLRKIRFEISCGRKEQLKRIRGKEIVLCGRSNVGKSTLINRIFERKGLAKTSGTPGKTATINFYDIEGVKIVDLPGYGYAKVSKEEKKKWQELILSYFGGNREIRLVIQLIDMRHRPSKQDETMINYLIDMEIPMVVVLTKSDKLTLTQRLRRKEELREEIQSGKEITMIEYSSITGKGIKEVREIINEVV